MTTDLSSYRTFVFDCDGVVLNSNSLKTRAFREVVNRYGDGVADRFVEFHERTGGVSRYEKFRYLFREFLSRAPNPGELQLLCDAYAEAVWEALLKCEVAPGLHRLRRMTPSVRWLVVSGGDQEELRRLFSARHLDGLFDGGIFGSPAPKIDILRRQLAAGNLRRPAVFFGDSTADYESARSAEIDFVFVFGWTDLVDWRRVFSGANSDCIRHLGDLLPAPRHDAPEAPRSADVDSTG